MGRRGEKLSAVLRRGALAGIRNDVTRRNYRKNIDRFTAWAAGRGLQREKDLQRAGGAVAVIQAYADHLRDDLGEDHAATIHTYLSPICKGLGVHLQDIQKPRRSADRIYRGRDPRRGTEGDREAQSAVYARLVTLQRAAGIRRAELAALTAADLQQDESGAWCIHVRRGKGGKEQLQRIADQDLEAVLEIMAHPRGHNGRIFAAREMSNHIDLHEIRRQRAQRAYAEYEEICRSAAGREQLRRELIARYAAMGRAKGSPAREAHFRREIEEGRPEYRLRGANAERARAAGRPISYDRLALMAVSVFHLSHWRLGVTVINYMI